MNIIKSANLLTRNPRMAKIDQMQSKPVIQESAVPKNIKDEFIKDLDSVLNVAILKKALGNLKENLGDALDSRIYQAMVEDMKKALTETKNEILSVMDSVNAIDIDLLPSNIDKEDSNGVELPDEDESPDEIDATNNKEFE